jgi:hypothetical protein
MDICRQVQNSIVKSRQSATIKQLTFSKTQWKFYLMEKNKIFDNLGQEKLCEEQLVSTRELLSCLNRYLDMMEDVPHNWDHDLIWIETFIYIKLITGEYVRATNDYHNSSWFSDIAIYMDESEHDRYLTDDGYCYGHVSPHRLIITYIYIIN